MSLFIDYTPYEHHSGLIGVPYAGRPLCFATVSLFFNSVIHPNISKTAGDRHTFILLMGYRGDY